MDVISVSVNMVRLIGLVFLLSVHVFSNKIIDEYGLFMPGVTPATSDSYLCTPVKIVPRKTFYIVGFEPKSSMQIAHHMLVYGCTEPGNKGPVWNCGEMSVHSTTDEVYGPCSAAPSIIYAWARDAPALELPPGVGFKIGEGTDVKYLVLQVHYSGIEVFNDGHKDASGVHLHFTEKPLPRLAAVLLMGTGGRVPAMSVESMESACAIKEPKVLHPFAYRTHTHSLGVMVAGYRVRRENGIDRWTLIGNRDPMTPQMFYPVNRNITIRQGDKVAASCKMVSRRNHTTYIGATATDEMCNFYLMYWVEDTAPLNMKYCFTRGPPFYYWSHEFNNLPLIEEMLHGHYLY